MTAIKVENLSKQFFIGARQLEYKTLRDTISDAVTAPFRKAGNLLRGKATGAAQLHESIWALQDVSFEIKQGEVVGIIGRNGAGKSTLLKILSRITEPTSGHAEIHGRVGSLLEVGTGFHQELTGRENIYLNGAILGMSKNDIARKFDEMVAFAEVEKFIDTPVKHYSSGMYLRLAFAVAAHLEPEILLVDEVLAVGDAAFQKKCLGKMGDVAKEGRTVLLVSHNMGSIRELTNRGIWLEQGCVNYDGNISSTIHNYLSLGKDSNDLTVDLSNHAFRLPRMKKILNSVCCRNSENYLTTDFSQVDMISLEIIYSAPSEVLLTGIGIIISTVDGIRVGSFNTYMAFSPPHSIPTKGKVIFYIPATNFTPDIYHVTISVASHSSVLEDKVESAINFKIHPADIYGTGYLLTKADGVAALSINVNIEEIK